MRSEYLFSCLSVLWMGFLSVESERLGFYEKGTKGGYFGYDWMNVMMLRFKHNRWMDGRDIL